MTYIIRKISFCNLKQACEWLSYYWEPLVQEDEDYLIFTCQRVRNPEDDEKCRLMPAILLAALRRGDIHLYRTRNDESLQTVELDDRNNNNESLKEFIERNLPPGIEQKIRLLEEITTHWFNRESLFFSFSELQAAFPPNQPRAMIGWNLKIYHDENCVFLQVRDIKILLKKFNRGTTKTVLKTLIDNPNKSFNRDDLLDGLVGNQRIDNIIRVFKQRAKESIEQYKDLSNIEKEDLKSKIDSSFFSRHGTYLFTPLT